MQRLAAPNLTRKEDGIWVERPSDTPEVIRYALTIEEFNALFDHPTGDYTVPALAIPCSLEEFMVDYNQRFAKAPWHDVDIHRPLEAVDVNVLLYLLLIQSVSQRMILTFKIHLIGMR
ncbi:MULTISPECIES: hypothetical protein [Enterobacterales]|uniref:hypothetical protein n=1 Tax=Enterobacterales TaxID=91347 RepID=UPI002ED9176C